MLTNQKTTTCTNCFNILGVESRMEIYKFIREKGRVTVTETVEHINLTQPTVSYHLKEMKGAGILNSQKIGKEVYYFQNDECPIYKKECILTGIKFPD